MRSLHRAAGLVLALLLSGCGSAAPPAHPTSPSVSAQETAEPTPSATAATEEDSAMLKLQIGDTVFTADLADNSTVDAFTALLADGPMTLSMSDFAGMEKGADLGVTLPQNNQPMDVDPGDIILYQGRTFVIYYDTNSWSLTPIARIRDLDPEELRSALGTGDVSVTLSLESDL